MVEKMTEEESKVQRAIRAARIAKQKLLEETRNAFALEDDTEVVKVKRPKAEKVTIKVPNQDKQGYGLAGVEEEYKIKKEDLFGPDWKDMSKEDLLWQAKEIIEKMTKKELVKFMETGRV